MKRHSSKILATFFAATVLLLAAKVTTDYDHRADFTRLKTYSWMRAEAGNPLWPDRIKRAVDTELSKKGWTEVPNNGDASLAAFGSTSTQKRLQTFYNNFGPGWGWRGFGESTTYVDEQPVGTLVVDIFDSHNKHLIWRGIVSDAISDKPEQNEKKLDKAVAQVFKDFPPKPRG
jgi:hypothetical protein